MANVELAIAFNTLDELQDEFEKNLKYGGAFAKGAAGFERGDDVKLVLIHPLTGERRTFDAAITLVVPEGENQGVGIAIKPFTPEHQSTLQQFMDEKAEQGTPPKKQQKSVHERIRRLTTAEQVKMAHSRNLTERVALERIYGKTVWEPLLRNASITIPEVSRIARMGSVPRPLLELIVSNGAWINTPHIRRALLSNPRLTGEMINRVVRAMPRNELKLAKKQTSYSQAVRNAATKLLKE